MLSALSRLLLSALVLSVLSMTAHAERFVLPDDAMVMQQINKPAAVSLDPDSISVLVWNIYKGKMSDWSQDYHTLSANKDILFLQEVWLNEEMTKVFNGDAVNSYLIATSFTDSWRDSTATGVATVSATQPVSTSYIRSHYREPFTGTPKMGLFVEYAIAGHSQTLLAANIHAINFVSAKKYRHMLNQIEVTLKTHNGPVILAGDFNTWGDARVSALLEMTKRLELTEVTFKDDTRTRLMGNVLDWIFVRDLRIKKAAVSAAVGSSDHRALEAELSLIR